MRDEKSGSTPSRLLMIDDEPMLLAAYRRVFAPLGIEILTCDDPTEALRIVQEERGTIDLVLVDLNMPKMSGFEVLERCLDIDKDLPVIMLTSDASALSAVKALKAGAFNYLTKPILDFEAAAVVLRGASKFRQLQREVLRLTASVTEANRERRIIGSSSSIQSLLSTIERIAPHDVSVLIRGESGTGKELAAREIHARSGRAHGPFLALNCAAIPETLVDSELFGHVRGAFTGASDARAGAFELASGGTLFLDEIGDIPLAVQTRLLRVLQEQEVTRLGSGTPRKINVRVLAATLVDLESAITDGTFREDLFYRLDVVGIDLPPLRHRLDDLPILASYLLNKQAERLGLEAPQLSPEAIDALSAYHWPGNVRELENAMQHALTLTRGSLIMPGDLPPRIRDATPRPASEAIVLGESIDPDQLAWADDLGFMEARQAMQETFEKAYLSRLLESTAGNISEAARRTGLDRSNLRRIMTRNGLRAEDYANSDE